MKNLPLILFSISILMISCSKEPEPGIEGLWAVTSVKAGENEMTPKARWMRFNSDLTQESGNGWLQHSIGTWELDKNSNQLTILNSNGLKDPNEPFTVSLSENEMIWERKEEGQDLIVYLERVRHLPIKDGDRLYGLWKLKEATGKGAYFSPTEESEDYIFFRWDNRFVIGGQKGRINGVYNVHGHKPEVELIPYGTEFQRNFWKFEVNEDTIVLNLLNTDSLVTRTFTRISEFPE